MRNRFAGGSNRITLSINGNALIVPLSQAWLAMDKRLQGFAYKIDINWWVFFLAGGVAALIALATISIQSIKAALANPVKSLKGE